ncbi:uncharacterized protein B0T15DRAFT_527888 [Chaetomium strumarium]|uniref:Uncharacterized protein n=1 Tax=Chaetomium strumarium TaxID=1170767 RepID=A0AAJ0GVK5_9PEZI|nr:hypothetical protein B0T15DRAFT_527888 [Chaetomium strumarium]
MTTVRSTGLLFTTQFLHYFLSFRGTAALMIGANITVHHHPSSHAFPAFRSLQRSGITLVGNKEFTTGHGRSISMTRQQA